MDSTLQRLRAVCAAAARLILYGSWHWRIRTTKRDPRNASALGGSKLRSYIRRLWTKIHQVKWTCAEEIAVYNAVFCLAISCSILAIFAIKFAKLSQICSRFWYFWAAKCVGEEPQISDPTNFFAQRRRGCGWSSFFQMFDMSIRSRDIRDQSRKLSEIAPKFGRFLAPPFFGGRAFQKLYARYHPCLASRIV